VSGAPEKRAGLPYAVRHLFRALWYSLQGVGTGFRLSLSFRQEVLVLAVLCLLLAWRGKPASDWLLCLGCWGLVMVVELLNTAVEEALDLITTDYSIPVKNAKDMASAAVFFLLAFNAAVWLFLFWNDLAGLCS
jgi:diacylglycerol kinase (ATP)